MTQEEAFKPILDSDETIIESFRPNKKRFIAFGIVADLFKVSFFLIFGFVVFGLSFMTGWVDQDGNPVTLNIARIVGLVVVGLSLLFLILAIIWRIIQYKKIWFCYTNKRIIVRSGFVGVDFETLDFDMIGAMNVRVDLLDKLVKPNTGSLLFASAASPMISDGRHTGSGGYMFINIQEPYEVYKRVKEYSSKNRDGSFNS